MVFLFQEVIENSNTVLSFIFEILREINRKLSFVRKINVVVESRSKFRVSNHFA